MENKRTRIKAKPYPLNWKILNLLKIFNTIDLEGFVIAIEGNYSKHAIRKELPKLERGKGEYGETIYSTRDENKNKIYRLTQKGINLLKELQIKSGGYEEADYNNWLLHWSVKVGGNRIGVSKIYGVDAIKIDRDNKLVALIIEKEGEKLQELKERVKQAVFKGIVTKSKSIPFHKLYVVIFCPEWDNEILSITNGIESEKSCTTVELFKIE